MCIARLMDFLGSDHEVLRNEALLLLVGLARASADIQKIVVFDGAFERALGIARHESVATQPRTLTIRPRVQSHHCFSPGQQPSRIAYAAGRKAARRAASWCRTAWSCSTTCCVLAPPTSSCSGPPWSEPYTMCYFAEAHARYVESVTDCGRETGHVGALLTLLHMPPPRSARRRGLARQAAANLLAVLETVHLLLAQPASPGGQARASAATERGFPCTP